MEFLKNPDKIKSSALFFALNSRNFLKSEYCAKELALFHQYPGGLLVGEQSRIFNILLNNIPYPQWPAGLGRTSGFPVHDARADELGDFTSLNDPRVEKQLRAIIDAVEKTLDAFPKAAPAARLPEKSGVRVFIADEMQREFLQRLENGDRAGKHYEFVRDSLTGLLELVQQKIAAMPQPPNGNGAARSFLIDTYQSDQAHAFRLAAMLA
ncbi:hypothetical protein L0337_32590 [candidate division KSB1 bacterium]|nr:hypothetical protein [candidate division KSB1 bacterium]